MSSKTVYSTEHGRICPDCDQPAARCRCPGKKKSAPGQGTGVRVSRETKGRKGKGVTNITGLPLNDDQLRSLAKELKQKCGSGGTAKSGVIEIQGDHRDILLEELKARGYKAKRSGG